ncbi:unnamed protein product [Moneuplotes crassus]|uniref:Uncharacterized protein n=1 Tax=Euplotes crassus TaxID=5936 RepID=A0AAD1US83_EUPCR|nr:unnamed protein product [Moneuplotes crassus]
MNSGVLQHRNSTLHKSILAHCHTVPFDKESSGSRMDSSLLTETPFRNWVLPVY